MDFPEKHNYDFEKHNYDFRVKIGQRWLSSLN